MRLPRGLDKIPIIYLLCPSFIAGLGVGSRVPADFDQKMLVLSLILFLILGFLFRRDRLRLFLSVIFISLFVGILRFQAIKFDRPVEVSGKQTFVGLVSQMPRVSAGRQKIRIKDVLITTNRYPEYHYGDVLQVAGQRKSPEDFESFAYKSYLKQQGVNWLVDYPEIGKIGEGGNFLVRAVSRFRQRFEEAADQLFPEPQSSLLVGMVAGIDREIPKGFSESLKRSGLLHVIVVSGYNVSLIVMFFQALSGIWGRLKSLLFSAVGVFLYLLLVGFSPPVLRAALMAWLALLGKAFGRQREALLALVISASILLFANPLNLFSISFQLSFAATLGLLLLSQDLKEALFFLPEKLADAAATTVAASSFVLPILAANFGAFSIVSPLSNILIILLIEPILFLGISSVFLSFFSALLAKVLSFLAWVPLTLFVVTADFMSRPNWANLEIGRGNIFFWFGYYVLLGMVVIYFRKINESFK